MIFSNTVLDSIACELPPEVWSSSLIEEKLAPLYEKLKLPFGRLELMTGIKERRFWPQSVLPSSIAALAGKKALDNASVSHDQIDVLVYAGVCRDCIEPSTAAYVHSLLKLSENTQILDLSNACLGFLNSMIFAASMIESGLARAILIVSGEDGRPLLESTINLLLSTELSRNAIKPFFANLTIGSGAVGAVISKQSMLKKPLLRFLGGISLTDSSANKLCEGIGISGSAGTQVQMQTNSEELLKAGIHLAKKAWTKFQSLVGFNAHDFDCTICHQVGKRHLTEFYKELHLIPDKDFSTFPFLGNVGSASVPITLAMALESGKIYPGDRIGLFGIGSGLSSIILGLEAM